MIRCSRSTLALVVAALTACRGDTGTQPVTDPATVVARVTISAPRTSLAVGGTLQLAAQATNSVGTILVDKTIDWASSRPDVATITSLGLVTGVATGTTVIRATSGGRSGSVTLTVQAPNQVVLTSDAGDYIGGGGSYSYTNSDAEIHLSASATSILLSISGDQRWNATFQVPSGSQLAPRSYTDATRWPFQGSGAGLSWYGEGRGCNTLTGFFTIDSLRWSGGVGSSLLGIDMRFEQHCEGASPALRGTIHWRADDPTVAPGPVTPIPTSLWQPPPGAVPSIGNVTYLQSDPGEYVGQGATTLYQTSISVAGTGRHATVSVGGYHGEFEGMDSISELQVGYYSHLMRYPFNNPVRGGLDWFGNGVGCNTLTGWFIVDRVNYVNGALTGIELRFEQHCDAQGPALHGMVRWGEFAG